MFDDINTIPTRRRSKRKVPFIVQYVLGGILGLIIGYFVLLKMGIDLGDKNHGRPQRTTTQSQEGPDRANR